MQKQKNRVYGVGINDAGYPTEIRKWEEGQKKLIWRCPFYRAWSSMLQRCYSDLYQSKKPTYIGCTVVQEWHVFSVFRAWMASQPYEGNQLDKDILIPGNKVYGPNLCLFVSGRLNNFLIDSGAARGEWPIGVSWHKHRGRFQAQCNNPFTGEYESIGFFDCPNEAHLAWRKRKTQIALELADMQDDLRISEALRMRFA